MTPEQIAAVEKAYAGMNNPVNAPALQLTSKQIAAIENHPSLNLDNVESQLVRSGAQGATLGYGDEIEAAIRSVLPNTPNYKTIRDDIRKKLADYRQANPTEAITAELAGALLPGILSRGATKDISLARLAAQGSGVGGIAGYGFSDSDDAIQQGVDTAIGSVIGMAAVPAITYLGKSMGELGSKAINWAREKLGTKASDVVQEELNRLMEATGKSADEIIHDVQSGRIMADNQTLTIALKNIANEGGEAGRRIIDLSNARAKQTTDDAMKSLKDALAPSVDDNTVRAYKATDDALKDIESQAYQRVFSADTGITQGIADSLLSAVRTVPGVADDVVNNYNMRNIVPLFKKAENGAIEFIRQPTLEDAEIVRRALSDKTTAFYKDGKGQLGGTLKEMERALRTAIDEASPDLRSTREFAAGRRSAKESFELGRKALSKNVDELEMMIEQMPEPQLKAFRAGVMDAIRNKARRTGTTMSNLANEDHQMGQVLRLVAPESKADDLVKSLSIAGDAKAVNQKIPPVAGSPTAALQQERSRAGFGTHVGGIARLAAGDTGALFDMASRFIQRKAPKLSDKERTAIVEILFERNPETVRRALVDDSAAAKLVNALEDLALKIGNTSGKAATIEGTVMGHNLTEGVR